MRANHQVERDVIEELACDPELEGSAVMAGVESGIVQLRGSAPTYSAKVAAVRAAERISGVRGVRDEIIVAPPASLARTDPELARDITTAFHLNARIPRDTIRFSVLDGWVTLEGRTARPGDRAAVEATVTMLAGVRGITNRIAVAPPPTCTIPLVPGIERALQRSADLDSKHIAVESSPDGEVLLRGMVRSWAEVRDAERAAWSAPGVRGVTNRLIVW